MSFLPHVYTIKSNTLDHRVKYHALTGNCLLDFVFFQSRGNSSSSANGHDMQSIRSMEGNEVCVDCGAPSKLGLLLLFHLRNALYVENHVYTVTPILSKTEN